MSVAESLMEIESRFEAGERDTNSVYPSNPTNMSVLVIASRNNETDRKDQSFVE